MVLQSWIEKIIKKIERTYNFRFKKDKQDTSGFFKKYQRTRNDNEKGLAGLTYISLKKTILRTRSC